MIFAIAVPFASTPLARAPAFVAAYQSALAVNDLVTAVLIFLQFKLAQSRAILAVASAYLFTAILAVLHQLLARPYRKADLARLLRQALVAAPASAAE